MIKIVQTFPLPTIQSGAMLGNGKTGILLWGEKNILNITIGCADLWDHRGGMTWTDKQNYHNICDALARNDQKTLDELFPVLPPSDPVRRPTLIPVGRVRVTLPEAAQLLRYEQDLMTSLTEVFYLSDGREMKISFYADMSMQEVLAMKWDGEISLSLLDSYSLSAKEKANLATRGFPAPEHFPLANGAAFVQPMPADPEYVLAYRTYADSCIISFDRDKAALQKKVTVSFDKCAESARKFWKDFWQDIPTVEHYDNDISRLYWHGLYKYGIMTNPAGVTPGLQGPWIEDDHLPPWSGDYHFNINVQMCNMPGYRSGKKENLKKLFDLVLSWRHLLQENARDFTGKDDGYMLPHAVDDHAVCMGGFWSGNIDHGCSAWIAGMMFDYCDCFGDMEFLKNDVFDFMRRVMNVFKHMLEYDADNALCLPVSISPEYRGSQIDAWGRNSSFQLAALHRLNENLLQGAKMLGIEPEPFWLEVQQKLPRASIVNDEIAIWDGLLLEESHRHHSHLAGICPFDVIDPHDEKWQKIVANSLERWYRLGMGLWSGWCLSWASQIYTRTGNGEMANLILTLWIRVFTNCGGGSLHYARFPGFGCYAGSDIEIMQMDGAMGAVTAIQDQFIHSQNGILRLFYGIPAEKPAAFERMFAPGGFRVSAKRSCDGKVQIEVAASRDNELKIQLPGTGIYNASMRAGEILTLTVENSVIRTA